MNGAVLLAAWERAASEPPLRRALTLLATVSPDRAAEDWARASIGERDQALLGIREEIFGAKLEAVADCPACGQQLDVSFGTRDLLPDSPVPRERDEGLRVRAGEWDVIYRLPTTADLLEIAGADPAEARKTVLARCLGTVRRGDVIVDTGSLPDAVTDAVVEDMARTDPRSETEVALECPACSHAWSMPFDVLTYLWSEIDDWARRFLVDIHVLASTYGCCERDIVALHPVRRRLYLEMLRA